MFDALRRTVGLGTESPALLLIDDDDVVLRLLQVTFRDAPFRTLLARTAAEALQLARAHRPALSFLDVGLGAEDGLRLCRMLKTDRDTRAMRIVVLSGHDDARTRTRAHQAGADGFIAKPFSPLALWQMVDETLVTR